MTIIVEFIGKDRGRYLKMGLGLVKANLDIET
jgi:hypothetical protein